MTSFRILPQARAELRDAVTRSGAGREFMAEVRRGVAAIVEAPERWPRWSEARPERKLVLRRFPYLIIYEILGDVVVIKAIAHMKRKPAYWRGRSPKR